MKENVLKVKKRSELFPFLIEAGYARGKVKSLLKYQNIFINGKLGKYNDILEVGDQVVITNARKVHAPFSILYEDSEFLVISKKAKLSTVSPANREQNLFQMAKKYLQEKNTHEPLFVLHRLDKETSGIVVFCKNRELTYRMQENWNRLVTLRKYTAVVLGKMEPKSGTLIFYLQENGAKNVVITDSKHGKKAITKYRVLQENKTHSLVELFLLTGRKNQIRVTLSHIGNPIVGDQKYYSKENLIGRIALVHNEMEWIHPDTKKIYHFQIEIPKEFQKLVK